MVKLYAVWLGGTASGCNIEVHDIQFVVGEMIEDTYVELKQKWFGDQKGVHMDAYMELTYIDGYEITLQKEKIKKQEKCLYFVHVGAFDPKKFGEVHENGFYVAAGKREATHKAFDELCIGGKKKHKDSIHELDGCIEIDTVNEWRIVLTPTLMSQNMRPDWFGYRLI